MPALRTRDTNSRPLDVTTDVPQLPSLNIVSPTPRSFTFPSTHNFSDSPYSSPSSSPFEPDLFSFPPQLCPSFTIATPPPPIPPMRSESPLSPVSPASHKRRKSTCSSDVVERRPKKGDEDYIKRPENAFILFRRKCCEDRQAEEDAAKAEGAVKKPRQADLSKTISQMWKGLPSEERQKWEQMAKDRKKEHEQMYPNYVYRPQRSKDKDGKTKANRKSSLKKLDESESLSFVVPVPRPHLHGRSASAPTPPPYQSIQIPNIYHITPSCPTSPSLLPMISRRSAHPGHPEDIMANFDYLPSNNYLPPSFPMPGQFEASLQSSDFLRNLISTGGQRKSEPTLQHLTIGSPDAFLLPPHQIVTSAPSIDSGSSGPSSPSSGPYTPTSAVLPSNDFAQLTSSGDAALDAQAQAEINLQIHMQMQQEFANFAWDSTSVWSSEPTILLEDDFDINAIPPIELGMPKYVDHHAHVPAAPDVSHHHHGLEFGQGFAHAAQYGYKDGGLIAFEEMMAGHTF